MEKLIRPSDKECMKTAMLKHEETFKEQVYELHRLYQIQKLLMKTIGIGSQIDRMDRKQQERADLERPAEDSNAGRQDIGALGSIDESQIELTLGPSSYYSMSTSRSKFKGETRLSSSSSLSSSSTGSSDNIISSKPGIVKKEHELLLKSERLRHHPPWIFQALSLNSN